MTFTEDDKIQWMVSIGLIAASAAAFKVNFIKSGYAMIVIGICNFIGWYFDYVTKKRYGARVLEIAKDKDRAKGTIAMAYGDAKEVPGKIWSKLSGKKQKAK